MDFLCHPAFLEIFACHEYYNHVCFTIPNLTFRCSSLLSYIEFKQDLIHQFSFLQIRFSCLSSLRSPSQPFITLFYLKRHQNSCTYKTLNVMYKVNELANPYEQIFALIAAFSRHFLCLP